MKKLKFLILAFGLLAAQWVLAVQLPSTSYRSTGVSVDNDGIYTASSGIMVKGNFSALGVGTQECAEACQAAFAACMERKDGFETCAAAQETCMSTCQGDDDTPLGPDSPIDEGLWILLTLALLSGILSVMLGRAKQVAVKN